MILGVAAIIGSLIPLVPFFFLDVTSSIWTSIVVLALTLFAVGFYKAPITIGKPYRSGLQMMLIGSPVPWRDIWSDFSGKKYQIPHKTNNSTESLP